MTDLRLPADLEQPAFLMSAPFTVSNAIRNNAWMDEGAEPYDRLRAFRQWEALYRALTLEGFVWLLPPEGDFQDRPFVADVAAVMHHTRDLVVISNFSNHGRFGEEGAARRFFHGMGYDHIHPPFPFQGEADLKHLRGNLYIGGYGQRSDFRAFHWIASHARAEIVEVELTNPKAYHLDASLFPLREDMVLMAASLFSPEDVKKVEAVAEIVEVPSKWAYSGWTNLVRLGRRLLHNPSSRESAGELRRRVEARGFDLIAIDLSEFDKSGADLSCLVNHLNEKNR